MQPTGVDDLLFWLTTAGGASAAVAFLLGFSERFLLLPDKAQFAIRVGLMVAIALGSQFGIQFIPPETKAALAPYVNTLGIVLGGTFVVQQAGKTGEFTGRERAYRRAIERADDRAPVGSLEVKKDGD